MRRIRPMQFRDASRVAQLHEAAMGQSLWAQLGLPFLRELYKALVDCPFFIGFVYVEEGEVKGFIAGTTSTQALYDDLFRRRAILMAPAAALGILRRPWVLRPLAQTALYTKRSGAQDVSAESLFCTFVPDLRGKRVSGHINKVLFDELLSRGAEKVKISTELNNEGAIRQLLSWDFEEVHRFRFYGKEMVTYVLDLANSPRVQPLSRHPAV
jgi:hypothetical protein